MTNFGGTYSNVHKYTDIKVFNKNTDQIKHI